MVKIPMLSFFEYSFIFWNISANMLRWGSVSTMRCMPGIDGWSSLLILKPCIFLESIKEIPPSSHSGLSPGWISSLGLSLLRKAFVRTKSQKISPLPTTRPLLSIFLENPHKRLQVAGNNTSPYLGKSAKFETIRSPSAYKAQNQES